jgi:hypothetical protein
MAMKRRTTLAVALAAVLAGGAAHAAVTQLEIYKQPNFQGASHVVKGEVNVLEGGFAKESSSLKVKGGYWEVCNEDRFKGDCRVLAPGDYPRLNHVLDDRIVSVRFLGNDPKLRERVARLDEREARREWREERREDRREWREERREDRREDRREWRQELGAIDLYGRPDFRGRSVRVQDEVRDLDQLFFDGRASSVIVHEGTWQLCSEPNFRGRCGVFRPGEYAHIASLDDRVSSIRQLR